MFVKQIKYRCERVQERMKQCRSMNVFPKVLAVYTFPDNGDNGEINYFCTTPWIKVSYKWELRRSAMCISIDYVDKIPLKVTDTIKTNLIVKTSSWFVLFTGKNFQRKTSVKLLTSNSRGKSKLRKPIKFRKTYRVLRLNS